MADRMSIRQRVALGWDIAAGKVVGTWDRGLAGIEQVVFLPLALMSQEQVKQLEQDEALFAYEYVTADRCPMGVNGYPSFTSVRFIRKPEWPVIRRSIAWSARVQGLGRWLLRGKKRDEAA